MASRLLRASLGAVTRQPFIQGRRSLHNSIMMRDTILLKMPALSPTMKTGKLIQWMKAAGDEVSAGDVLYEIETDKAVMSVEATEDGYLAKILVGDDSEGVPIDKLVGLMVEEEGEEPEMPEDEDSQEEEEEESPVAPANDAPKAKTESQGNRKKGTDKPLSPAVKYLIGLHRIDVAEIEASGRHGRLLKSDVLEYIEKNGSNKGKAPSTASTSQTTSSNKSQSKAGATSSSSAATTSTTTASSYSDIPTSNIRKIIAQRLSQSKQTIPHGYVEAVCNIDAISSLIKANREQGGPKYSLNDVIVRASALALSMVPEVNTVWRDGQAVSPSSVDVSVAVATDTGLITPIVFNANRLNVHTVGSTIKELAEKARANKLQPQEFQGGTFSVSNLGMFGIKQFTAVINPPQTCILAVGTKQISLNHLKKPITRMSFTLSYDARVVPEEKASEWLRVFTALMEQPSLVANTVQFEY